MNETEDRLRRALEAQAAQVTSQSLRSPAALGEPRRRRSWTAPVLLVGAAAATVGVLVVVSVFADSASGPQDTPPAGTPEQVITGSDCPREAELVRQALAGQPRAADVDGDGSADEVALAVDELARPACRAFVGVRTTEGATYSAAFDASAVPSDASMPNVIGFPDLGDDPGAEIAVDTGALADGALGQLFTLTDTGLVRVAAPAFEDGNFLIEGGGVTNPQGAGCTPDGALVLSMATAVHGGADYQVTRQVYPVHGDDPQFTGPEVSSATVPADRLAAAFPEFATPHFEECESR